MEVRSHFTSSLTTALATCEGKNRLQNCSSVIQGKADWATFYISDLLYPYQPVRSLRSSIKNRLEIPFVKTVFASRAFSVAAPQIWNKLPDYIKNSDTISKFG